MLPHVRGKSRDRGGIWIHKTCLSGSFIAEDHFWIKREHTVRNDLSEKSYYSILLALNGSDEAFAPDEPFYSTLLMCFVRFKPGPRRLQVFR